VALSFPIAPRRNPRRKGGSGWQGEGDEAGKLTAPDVKAGDRILFGKYSGSEVKLDDEEHLILREDDILGVLEG
jgi:co-chaperonin GroES (HSP10)